MHNTIVHWRHRAARYGLRASPGAVVFTQDNTYGLNSGKMHANNGQRYPRDLSKVKCFRCQEFGHFSNKCPNEAKIGETHANVGTKDMSGSDMDRLMSTLEIDIDADYFFEGFDMVTIGYKKRYL